MKKIFTAVILAATTLCTLAAPLTPEQALRRAQGNGPMRVAARNASPSALVKELHTPDGNPAVYVFSRPSEGFVIVSGDDAAQPLLGYSDSGSFDANNLPPQLEWWLSQYVEAVSYAVANGIDAAAPSSRAQKAAITPLISTKWNQNSPYNQLCPSVGASKCPTGCVATAMAQVMKHWNYPAVGSGRVTAILPSGASGTSMLNLANLPFTWSNMIDTYTGSYTPEQASAVATLMQAVGYSVKMNYGTSASGAQSINTAVALTKNFSYNPNIQYLKHEYFNATLWDETIYSELAAGRPVLYSGASASVGHEFVCDGYDGNGYFHFNWGWGGMSDGYFLLDALNPDSVGTGGGEGGGYNSVQDIVIGIQPTAVKLPTRMTQFGTLQASASGLTLSLTTNYNNETGKWVNYNFTKENFYIGAQFTPTSGNAAPVYVRASNNPTSFEGMSVSGNSVQFYQMTGNASISVPASLPDGRYKVTICSQSADSADAAWLPMLTAAGNYNFVYVTKSGNSCSVQTLPQSDIKILAAEPATEIYYNNACKLKIRLQNPSDLEITESFYPVLLSGSTEVMMGEGLTVTLQPGETVERELLTTFELISGQSAPTANTQYTLKFLKGAYSTEYYAWSSQLTMKVFTGNMSLLVSSYVIDGASTRTLNVNGTEREVMVATDKAAIPFTATVRNTSTFFGSQIYSLIFNGDLQGYNIATAAMGPTPILASGEGATVKGSLDFSEATDGSAYAAIIFFRDKTGQLKQSNSPILYFTVEQSSGVADLSADAEASITFNRADATLTAPQGYVSLEVYNLAGVKLAQTEGDGNAPLTLQLTEKAEGFAVAIARTSSGSVKTLKIRL